MVFPDSEEVDPDRLCVHALDHEGADGFGVAERRTRRIGAHIAESVQAEFGDCRVQAVGRVKLGGHLGNRSPQDDLNVQPSP